MSSAFQIVIEKPEGLEYGLFHTHNGIIFTLPMNSSSNKQRY